MEKDRSPNQVASFLIRCRTLRKGDVQYHVRHIQSGHEAESENLEAVMTWLESIRKGIKSPPI